ncbi:MAG: type II CAAX prenyl endopeptidase Rce1 family protein [Bacteroidota bacterium]
MIFGALSFLKIQYQFYIWEILIDLKVVAMVVLLYAWYRKNEIVFSRSQLSFFSLDWKKNVLLFSVPLIIYAITIGIGIAVSEVKINKLDNAATLILATIFDIPAIYVFSATSILIEELVFRGILLRSFGRQHGLFQASMITAALWLIFMVTDVFGTETFTIELSLVLALYFLASGFLLSSLSLWKGNVWLGYSLRIGLITLTPIILTSRINESDSSFTTESLYFIAEGISVTVIVIIMAVFFYSRAVKLTKVAEK